MEGHKGKGFRYLHTNAKTTKEAQYPPPPPPPPKKIILIENQQIFLTFHAISNVLICQDNLLRLAM